jgi:hypothetical protein
MPETTSPDSGAALTPAQLADALTALTHGPYGAASTVGAADLAAEAVRYLNHAAAKGGITDPATIATLTSLAAALAAVHNLTATLHTAEPAAPAV